MRPIEQLEKRRLLTAFTASSVADLIADINAANAAGGSNTITLAAGSAFNLAVVDNQTDFDGPTGLPAVAAGDDLTVLGNGDTIGRSTTRGTPEFRLFKVAAGASLALNNLTLSGGVGRFYGGALLNRGTLSLKGVTVQGCAAKGWSQVTGGGIYSNGTLTVADSAIQNNQALGDNGWLNGYTPYYGGTAYGGGVYVGGGNAAITNSTFTSNVARGGNGLDAQHVKAFKTWIWLAPSRGGDGYGGGIYAGGGTLQIRGTSFTANSAQGGLGGNAHTGADAADGNGVGGGIYVAPAAPAGLDAFTQSHTTSNTASTSDNDIFGSFTIL
jgi:hypothetical protein